MTIMETDVPEVSEPNSFGLQNGRPAALRSKRMLEPCWAESDVMDLVCSQVLAVTHDVKTFVFTTPDRRAFDFEAGQFITIRVEIDGEMMTRCYTIASPPTRPDRLAITVKRVPDGVVSNWLHDNLEPGAWISMHAPAGAFVLPEEDAPKYLFLSAGSGITPVLSMTRTLYDLGSEADILFVHSARTPADIIYRGELEAMARLMPNLRVVEICEGDAPTERWMGLQGRISKPVLEILAPDLNERETFICGPAGYMAAAKSLLEELDYDMEKYHEESFDFGAPEMPTPSAAPPSEQDVEDEAATGFSVEFARSGRMITCGPEETLLEAAVAAGMRPLAACGQGMCGTCKVSMLSGEVDMQHNGGIRPKEIAQQKVLICCSKPLGDIRLDC
ncbi:hybrid-cluster NAD(P)-dependent oxidoreductase [Nocardioides sp. NPDC127503]|uniref:hybrid-cluster NAD(P)-dependent oxidoreductase n=1 Tax=Nocardioides sp. NPDC127503 TaxID=3154516 RepID=UPI00331A6EFC